jgi:hypothetical protein
MRRTLISSTAAWRLWSSISRMNSCPSQHSLPRVLCVHSHSLPVSVPNRRQCNSYNRLLRDAIASEESAPTGDDLEALMDADGEDDKTYAAMGVAKTLSTVSFLVGTRRDVYADDSADRDVHRLFAGDSRPSTGGHHSDHPGNSREKGPWYVVGT